MPHRVRLPRLSRSEVEELVKAHGCLVAADRALREGGWKGAPAMIELVGIVDALIARLYNKAEVSTIRQSGAPAAETAPGAPLEQHPTDEAGQERYGAPAKPEA